MFATEAQIEAAQATPKPRVRPGKAVVTVQLPDLGRTLELRPSEPPEGVDSTRWRNALRRIDRAQRIKSHVVIYELVRLRVLTVTDGAHELQCRSLRYSAIRGRVPELHLLDITHFAEMLTFARDEPAPPPRPVSLWTMLEETP